MSSKVAFDPTPHDGLDCDDGCQCGTNPHPPPDLESALQMQVAELQEVIERISAGANALASQVRSIAEGRFK